MWHQASGRTIGKGLRRVMLDVSIIIVSYNVREHLERCLSSIFNSTARRPAFEAIVIDNASSDRSPEMVRLDFPAATLIANSENAGFAAACNQGIEIARGRYLLLLNPDATLLDDTLKKTIDFMDAHPEAAAAGCKLLHPDGSWHPSTRPFSTLANQLCSRVPILNKIGAPTTSPEYLERELDPDAVRAVDYVWGAFLLMRREDVESIGPLDERFFMYSEDEDWCYRARRAGRSIYYAPVATAVHAKGQSSKLARERMRTELFRSRYMYFLKHRGRAVAEAYRLLLGLTACLQVIAVGIRWPRSEGRNERVRRFHDELSLAKSALTGRGFRDPQPPFPRPAATRAGDRVERAEGSGPAAGMRVADPPMAEKSAPRTRGEIRVLMVETGGWGGVALYAYDLCNALGKVGARVSLATTGDYEFAAAEKGFKAATVLLDFRSERAPANRLMGLVKKLRSLLKHFKNGARLLALASGGDFDLIHVQWLPEHLSLWVVRLLRLAGRPIVYTAHDVLPHEDGNRQRELFRSVYSLVDLIIVHSRYARDLLVELAPEAAGKIAIVPHGCSRIPLSERSDRQNDGREARTALGIPAGKTVASFVGSIRPYKGLDALIAAFAAIRRDLPDALLLVAGQGDVGPRADILSEMASEGSALTINRYLSLREIDAVLGVSDLLVLPYKHVYTSGILHLAQTYGVPVLARDVGGLAESIKHGETGLLVRADDPDALKRELRKALQDAGELARMSRNCLSEAEGARSWKRVAESTRELYADALRRRESADVAARGRRAVVAFFARAGARRRTSHDPSEAEPNP